MIAPLSAAVLCELQNPAPVGQRHAQMVRLACALLSAGLNDAEVFHRLRANYDASSLPDREIANAIEWAQKKVGNQVGNCCLGKWRNKFSPGKNIAANNPNKTVQSFDSAIKAFLGSFSCSESDLFDASPVRLPDDFRRDTQLVFENLYSASEKLNIVTEFGEQLSAAGTRKTSPIGFGKTFTRNEWLNRFQKTSIPETPAGAWFRINPVNGNGITDEHISQFRFALLESDLIPIEIQLSVFAKLPIPICAIVKSGGKSIHAWVRIAAKSADEYREKIKTLFFLLSPFGFDSSNRNPSRLSRLPGAQRIIGASGDGKQRLLYLNPDATERSIA